MIKLLVLLAFLLLMPLAFAQEKNCVYVCEDDSGKVPIKITGGMNEASSMGFGLMVMIISMSILAGWWIKASIVKVMKERETKPRKRFKASDYVSKKPAGP